MSENINEINNIEGDGIELTLTPQEERIAKLDSPDQIRIFHDNGLLLSKRVIYLDGDLDEDGNIGVDGAMSTKFIKNLQILEYIDPNEEVTVILNTCGGNVSDALAIFDAVRASSCFVKVIVYGQCMSAGSIILQAGNERVLTPNSLIMFHNGNSGSVYSNQWEMLNSAKAFYIQGLLADGIVFDAMDTKRLSNGQPKLTDAERKQLSVDGIYVTAKQAVEMGLADRIEDPYPVEE